MIFIDSHSHLYDPQFDSDRAQMMQRASDQGIQKIFMPNCDSTTIVPMLDVERDWPSCAYPMIGLHPVYVKENYQQELSTVHQWLKKKKFYAIGEVGLDKHWDLTFLEQQKEAFSLQTDWALQYDLPLVIHSRNATQESIEIVRAKQDGGLKGIFHCFGGTIEEAKQIIDLGFLLGIGGVLTFKNSGLAELLQEIPLESIVLETDAPYLAPVPYRGKRNESAYIPLIAQKLAEVKNMNVREVAEVTTSNAEKVFS